MHPSRSNEFSLLSWKPPCEDCMKLSVLVVCMQYVDFTSSMASIEYRHPRNLCLVPFPRWRPYFLVFRFLTDAIPPFGSLLVDFTCLLVPTIHCHRPPFVSCISPPFSVLEFISTHHPKSSLSHCIVSLHNCSSAEPASSPSPPWRKSSRPAPLARGRLDFILTIDLVILDLLGLKRPWCSLGINHPKQVKFAIHSFLSLLLRMKMRTSLFCALQGLGVVAHESLAYFKADHSKGGHRYLDGCGKAGKGNWVPDPATFVLPQNDFKPSDHWGLCASGHDCAPHEATGKVYFDFQDDGLIFNFEGIDHYKYEDVSIYVERARPPHAHSTKYNKDSDHCKAKNGYKEVKCHIPYFSLTDGGSYDKMCPLKGEGGWRFYIKIKATIVHGDKRYELYNRESTNGEKYFALSHTCGKCKQYVSRFLFSFTTNVDKPQARSQDRADQRCHPPR